MPILGNLMLLLIVSTGIHMYRGGGVSTMYYYDSSSSRPGSTPSIWSEYDQGMGAFSASDTTAVWTDRDKHRHTQAHLDSVLWRHLGWAFNNGWVFERVREGEPYSDLIQASYKRDSNRLNLSGSILKGASLARVDLRWADLTSAVLDSCDLSGSDLTGVTLDSAIVRDSDFLGAVLNDASVREADLAGARLDGVRARAADFSGARLDSASCRDSIWLSEARRRRNNTSEDVGQPIASMTRIPDLREAVFDRASLIGTRISGARLTAARLTRARVDSTTIIESSDLQAVVFAPLGTPRVDAFASNRNLEHLRLPVASRDASALIVLESRMRDIGQDGPADLVHAARLRAVAGPMRRIAFDWTVGFGSAPSRPLKIMFWVWVACSALYRWALGGRHARLFVVIYWPSVDEGLSRRTRVRRVEELIRERRPELSGWLRLHWLEREWNLLKWCALYSLTCTARMGIRGLLQEHWGRMLQPRAFDLRATGWVRVVGGVQSLVSVYLIALFLIVVLADPFKR